MEFEIDSSIRQGEEHKICQDYALHGSNPFPYIIIADGSSSSDRSEIGAKVLTLSAQKIILEHSLETLENIHSKELGIRIIERAQYIGNQLLLNENNLDTTLIIAWYDINKGQTHICFFGDGHLFYKKNESIYHYELEYEENYPFYLSYLLNEKRKQILENEIQQNLIIKFEKTNNEFQEKKYFLQNFYPKITLKNDLEWLCICSDGIETFNDKNTKNFINEFSDFKNFNGVFIERKLNKITKKYKKENITHYDDISIAGIYFKRET